MNGSREAYDRGGLFSPDGRLYQVEYAREAVGRGRPAVGVRGTDGVALAAERPARPLQVTDGVEKVRRIDDGVAAASAGHAADARRLVETARELAAGERFRYGHAPAVDALVRATSDRVQEQTQAAGTRPYGAALLVGGVDGTGARLFEVDPSGAPYEWRAAAIGDGGEAAREALESSYEETDAEAAGAIAVEALSAAGTADAERIEAGSVTADGYAALPDSVVADALGAS